MCPVAGNLNGRAGRGEWKLLGLAGAAAKPVQRQPISLLFCHHLNSDQTGLGQVSSANNKRARAKLFHFHEKESESEPADWHLHVHF